MHENIIACLKPKPYKTETIFLRFSYRELNVSKSQIDAILLASMTYYDSSIIEHILYLSPRGRSMFFNF